jgi:AraC family transcriptional regulator
MKYSREGEFYGKTNETVHLNGIILNDADYVYDKVDWHYHENAYFTFILQGSVLEGNKKTINECTTGTLLFHHWQDAHYNIGSKEFTRGFHVEIKPSWFSNFDISHDSLHGSIRISHPRIKILMYKIFKELKLNDRNRQLAIDALLVEIFSMMSKHESLANDKNPSWVNRVKDVLHNGEDSMDLPDLARLAGIHPVHLSRAFFKYFSTSLGDYARETKIQRALSLLPNNELSLTDIALNCGFSDQSHFNRLFKYYHQITPLQYRKLLLKN